MVSSTDIPGTAQQLPSSRPKTLVWQSDKYAHGSLRTGLHLQQGDISATGCFCNNTTPNPNLLVLVSKRNDLMKSAKANTGPQSMLS